MVASLLFSNFIHNTDTFTYLVYGITVLAGGIKFHNGYNVHTIYKTYICIGLAWPLYMPITLFCKSITVHMPSE